MEKKTYENSRIELHSAYKRRRGLKGKRRHGNVPWCMAGGGGIGYGFGLVGGMILGSGVLYVEVWCWKMIPSGSGWG